VNSLKERIQKIVRENVSMVPYDIRWPEMFEAEKKHLLSCLPHDIVKRIEHFGSTAVPGLSAKPVIDILAEVTSLEETKMKIVPILTSQGYEYFWRPTYGEDIPPFYAWFIKRNIQGDRTYHIHMVEKDFEHWERILFRDYLIENPRIAWEYQELKMRLASEFPNDRTAYTKAKTEFIQRFTELAKNQKREMQIGEPL
jgi:GrpB-like predicted nucleotidyltransferase (UPF0157 family)